MMMIWEADGLSAVPALQRLCFCRRYVGFLRQPPPANKNISRRCAGVPLQSLPRKKKLGIRKKR